MAKFQSYKNTAFSSLSLRAKSDYSKRAFLRRSLYSALKVEHIRALSFDFGLEFSDLGHSKNEKIINLLEKFIRDENICELLGWLDEENINMNKLPSE